MRALSAAICGIGYSRNSVLLGPVRTAASTFSTHSSDNERQFLMLAPSPNRLEAATRVKRWTRTRFSLSEKVTLFISEVESAVPGFPPLQTVVAFWSPERTHYHFTVFKPLEQVLEEDLPPAWYREALAVAEGVQCHCC
jgi:nitrate reductase delta subunit